MKECNAAQPKRLYEDEVLTTPCDSPNIWVQLRIGEVVPRLLNYLGVEVCSRVLMFGRPWCFAEEMALRSQQKTVSLIDV